MCYILQIQMLVYGLVPNTCITLNPKAQLYTLLSSAGVIIVGVCQSVARAVWQARLLMVLSTSTSTRVTLSYTSVRLHLATFTVCNFISSLAELWVSCDWADYASFTKSLILYCMCMFLKATGISGMWAVCVLAVTIAWCSKWPRPFKLRPQCTSIISDVMSVHKH